MADDLAAPNPELPAQATGGTLPGLAADLADIAPAPTPADALLEANFGARGAQQYRDLRAAGQATGAAPAPVTSPLDTLVGGGASAPAPTPAYNRPSELAAGGISRALQSFGNPQMAAQQQQAQQQQILAATKAKQQSSMELFSLIPTAFKQFAGRPDLAASFLQNEAQQRGIPLTPAVAMYLNQKIADGQLTLDDIENKMKGADLNTMQRYGTSLTEWSNVIRSQALTSKAIAEAANAPAVAQQTATKNALDIANKVRQAQREPTQNEIETLWSGGLVATQVPMPGSPSNKMWTTRPATEAEKAGQFAPGTINPTKLHEEQTTRAATKAREQAEARAAVDTTATRTMKEAAPKVLGFIKRVRDDLTKVETGPLKSRYQEAMTGTVGAENPEFARYRTDVALLSTLLMRMHVGARGSEGMLEHFKNLFNAGTQSSVNMKAALEAVEDYAKDLTAKKEGEDVTARGIGGGAGTGAPAGGEISAQDFLNGM